MPLRHRVLVAFFLFAACATVANAATHGTRAFYGPCIYGNDREIKARPSDGEGFAATLGAVVSGIIDAGLGRFGRALRAAGEEETTTQAAQKNIELGAGLIEPCVQIVRGRFTTANRANIADKELDKKINRKTQSASKLSLKPDQLRAAGIFLYGRPDFFAELQIRLSSDYSATSIAPTFVSYNRLLKDRSFKAGKSRGLALNMRFHPPGVSADEQGSTGGTVVLGDIALGTEIEYLIPDSIDEPYPVESAWFPSISPVAENAQTFGCKIIAEDVTGDTTTPDDTSENTANEDATNAAAAGPAASNPIPILENATRRGGRANLCKPFTITASIAETRDARPFMLFLADVFDSSKDTLKTDLENTLVESKRDEVELAAYTAEQNALVTFGQQKINVRSRMIEYCTADYSGVPESSTQLLALEKSQAVLAAQAAANISAKAAGLQPPYATLIVPSGLIPQRGITPGCEA